MKIVAVARPFWKSLLLGVVIATLGAAQASSARATSGRLIASSFVPFTCAEPCQPDGVFDLYVTGADRQFHRLMVGGRFYAPIPPRLSPDGRWILFATADGHLAVQRVARDRLVGMPDVLSVDVDGSDPGVSWAPDSAHLVMAGAMHAPGTLGEVSGVWVMRRDGAGRRQLLNSSTVNALGSEPAWSSRGDIAFVGRDPNRADQASASVYGIRADGTHLRTISSPPLIPSIYPDADGYPAWSPDGRRLVCSRGAFDDLRIIDVDRGTSHWLARVGEAEGSPSAWSPDAAEIAYVGNPLFGRKLHLIEPGGHHRLASIPLPGGVQSVAGLDWLARG